MQLMIFTTPSRITLRERFFFFLKSCLKGKKHANWSLALLAAVSYLSTCQTSPHDYFCFTDEVLMQGRKQKGLCVLSGETFNLVRFPWQRFSGLPESSVEPWQAGEKGQRERH